MADMLTEPWPMGRQDIGRMAGEQQSQASRHTTTVQKQRQQIVYSKAVAGQTAKWLVAQGARLAQDGLTATLWAVTDGPHRFRQVGMLPYSERIQEHAA